MSIRHTLYNGWLAKRPSDPRAVGGYDELVELWELIGEGNRDLTAPQLEDWRQKVRPHLTPREQSFFDEPMEAGISDNLHLVQTKMTGRLTKILLDRHGIKVATEKGGIGLETGN